RERVVNEQAPDVPERDVPGQVLDVHTAVPESPALPVGLGDLGLERHDAFEPGLEFGHVRSSVSWPAASDECPTRGARPTYSTASAASCLPPGSEPGAPPFPVSGGRRPVPCRSMCRCMGCNPCNGTSTGFGAGVGRPHGLGRVV